MLDRLAEQERVDQMARDKQRLRLQEHKRQVEQLWRIKLEQYRQVKLDEQREIEEQRLTEMWRINIVEQ